MSRTISYKNKTYKVKSIIWDRESLFIDFENYGEKFVGLISQVVAENTTTNWDKFNLVRTRVIKVLGINPSDATTYPSAPINIIPFNSLYPILNNSIEEFLDEMNQEDLNELLIKLFNKTVEENVQNLKDAILKDEVEALKPFPRSGRNILISNDSSLSKDIFKECLQDSYEVFSESHYNINKSNLSKILGEDSLLITKNPFLGKLFEHSLVIESIKDLEIFQKVNDSSFVINVDGASRGNPGQAGIGVAVFKDDDLIEEISEYIGEQTNNYAEYKALIRALKYCVENGLSNVEVRSDSELIVKQMKKEYKVKDSTLQELNNEASKLLANISDLKLIHVKREFNKVADKLANQALD